MVTSTLKDIGMKLYSPIVLTYIRQKHSNHVFKQDDVRFHVARICIEYLEQNHIRVLPWPAFSPDLSRIKHLWDELGTRVRERQNPSKMLQDLRLVLKLEVNNIPMPT